MNRAKVQDSGDTEQKLTQNSFTPRLGSKDQKLTRQLAVLARCQANLILTNLMGKDCR